MRVNRAFKSGSRKQKHQKQQNIIFFSCLKNRYIETHKTVVKMTAVTEQITDVLMNMKHINFTCVHK